MRGTQKPNDYGDIITMNDDTNQFDLWDFKEVSDAMLAFSVDIEKLIPEVHEKLGLIDPELTVKVVEHLATSMAMFRTIAVAGEFSNISEEPDGRLSFEVTDDTTKDAEAIFNKAAEITNSL